MSTLNERIAARTLRVGVVGLGYVGLPLATEFAAASYQVTGIDIDRRRVEQLQAGDSYISDVPSAQIASLLASGRLAVSSDYSAVSELDSVAICVPTPLRKSKEPDVSYIAAALDGIKPYLHKDMTLILESTTYPGTTEELVRPVVEDAGLKVGEDVFVCFSPERVDPANQLYRTKNTPKVIGGLTPACTEAGVALYSQVMDRVVPVSSARTAEMVKLLENTFRAVNIGLVNEMALMCERMGTDIWEVINAAATKPFGYMPFYPGPGIGGHCIPLDPMYLSWKAKTYDFFTRFIELASDINANMPYHTVERISAILNLQGKALSRARILCLGAAYKPHVNDTRESPAIDVMHLLMTRGARVEYADPFVPEIHEDGVDLTSVELTESTVRSADCVVLLTDHSQFDYELVARTAKIILDTRNGFKEFRQANIFRLGAPVPTPEEWMQRSITAEAQAASARDSEWEG